jgi:hypothetical protein
MPKILPHVLNSRAANGLHGNRVLQNVRVSLVLPDAGCLRILLNQAPRLASGDPEDGLIKL